MAMAEEEENTVSAQPEFPRGRVKKIMTLDKEVQRVSSEALFLVSLSTELFLQSLAEKSARVAIEKKRKTVKLEHIRVAVKRHKPTSDFLLDSLPVPSQATKPDKPATATDRTKPEPAGTRRIDQFFRKTGAEEAQAQEEAQTQEQAQAQAPTPVDDS